MTLKELIEKGVHPITGWKLNEKKYSKRNKGENEIRKYFRENYDLDGDKMAY
jgi:hypothetical protein